MATHGKTGTKEYHVWQHMHSRCRNPRNHKFPMYGGRGIKVCKRWESFEKFFEDMGPIPGNKTSIDRIDNDKGYFPGNCRWANAKQQANNTRRNRYITFQGKTKPLAWWAKKIGMKYHTLKYRLKIWGNNAEKALMRPVPSRILNRELTYKGVTRTVAQWALKLGMRKETLNHRLVIWGFDGQRALSTPLRKRKCKPR